MIAALIITLLTGVPADSLSVTDKSSERLSPVVSYAAENSHSAAASLFSPYKPFSTASLSWDRRGEEAPLLPEEGRFSSEGVIDIETLVRLDDNSAVHGQVQYRNGLKKGVMWNSSSDYDLIRPYAVSDSVGGDVRREQYFFTGGYASRKDRIHYGFEGSYRALHEYRMVDPRPRNIVSDLNFKVSAGYRINELYILDISASYRKYSQSQNISFYNQKGSNSSVFHLTGLGNHFQRFEGGTSAYTSTRYAGNGVDVSLNLLPYGVGGRRASLYYSLFDLVHHLPNQNEVPYTELYTRNAGVELSFVSNDGGLDYFASVHADYENRKGIESVIDNGSEGHFLELMRFSMYISDLLQAGFRGACEWGGDANRWSVEGNADYIFLNSSYVYPYRYLFTQGVDTSLKAGYMRRTGPNLFNATVIGGRYQSIGTGMSIPAEYTVDKLLTFYMDRRERFSQSSWTGGLSLRWEREISRFAVFLSGQAKYARLDSGSSAFLSNLTIGLTF